MKKEEYFTLHKEKGLCYYPETSFSTGVTENENTNTLYLTGETKFRFNLDGIWMEKSYICREKMEVDKDKSIYFNDCWVILSQKVSFILKMCFEDSNDVESGAKVSKLQISEEERMSNIKRHVTKGLKSSGFKKITL